ncbi:MAG: hypothetical protein GEU73_06130 [Chloroflexi bacterium]|nr:hypothetical protein [Chloroflexota bacterium]
MTALSDVGETQLLKYLVNQTPTAPVQPLKVALMSAAPSDSAVGTEIAGGSYARQNITFSAVSADVATNSADITFTNMPAATVGWVNIYDSAGTPVRWLHGALAASKTFTAGDSFTIPAGSLTITLA